jgi:hypothetical protein
MSRGLPEDIRSQIRGVLLRDWDPIGIDRTPDAADEYDSYIPDIAYLVSSKASVEKIQKYLFDVVSVRMGLSPPFEIEDMRRAAEALWRLVP